MKSVNKRIVLAFLFAVLSTFAYSQDELVDLHTDNSCGVGGMHHSPPRPVIECWYDQNNSSLLFFCRNEDVIAYIFVIDTLTDCILTGECDSLNPKEIQIQPEGAYIITVEMSTGQRYYGEFNWVN